METLRNGPLDILFGIVEKWEKEGAADAVDFLFYAHFWIGAPTVEVTVDPLEELPLKKLADANLTIPRVRSHLNNLCLNGWDEEFLAVSIARAFEDVLERSYQRYEEGCIRRKEDLERVLADLERDPGAVVKTFRSTVEDLKTRVAEMLVKAKPDPREKQRRLRSLESWRRLSRTLYDEENRLRWTRQKMQKGGLEQAIDWIQRLLSERRDIEKTAQDLLDSLDEPSSGAK